MSIHFIVFYFVSLFLFNRVFYLRAKGEAGVDENVLFDLGIWFIPIMFYLISLVCAVALNKLFCASFYPSKKLPNYTQLSFDNAGILGAAVGQYLSVCVYMFVQSRATNPGMFMSHVMSVYMTMFCSFIIYTCCSRELTKRFSFGLAHYLIVFLCIEYMLDQMVGGCRVSDAAGEGPFACFYAIVKN